MSSIPLFDADLLRRYDRPGPRYTSYPTAPQFSETFGATGLREHARRSNAEPIPRELSLYLHVPYCFSPCFYCGCNRIITHDSAKGGRYVERLAREIELMAQLFDRDRDVIQLHLGGGTPNFLRPAELRELLGSLDRHFHFSSSSLGATSQSSSIRAFCMTATSPPTAHLALIARASACRISIPRCSAPSTDCRASSRR